MQLRADKLLYIAVVFLIIGIILFVTGSSLPIPAIIIFSLASICFIIGFIIVILALCSYQRDYAQSRGREVF
ncbi:MAG: hypothetical protein ACFFCF_02970 [Promethearchaeota archaeon]